MSYKIAVVSSNGRDLDVHFGAAKQFYIYEVNGEEYHLSETRQYEPPAEDNPIGCETVKGTGCGDGRGCGKGCGGFGDRSPKVDLVSDCRCVVCKKIGFNIQKQLEKLAIVSFDVDCDVKDALDKITAYLNKVDSHQSLRGQAQKK